ncbi:acetoacetate--CoA ligase [Streptomyces sp. B-S-A12]|uniref:Acetoacetate--CoA ligase n=1 Tax=Streptomyces luteolus TaxID=3043615 RepID=A0ABT6SSV9_9ACTN|nr:acetoacetate--CoA ligase [Streptomyces sp. B-S-A12]MDI3418701.1 acetoacetate--CoA ligase [Streptomyces sp. B-S-A12]
MNTDPNLLWSPTDPNLLWAPTAARAEQSDVAAFLRMLDRTRGLRFADYAELWRWSTTEPNAFWAAVWEYYGLDAVSAYDTVLDDPRMPGARWFPGARINFAERCLARTPDERTALIEVSESGPPVETSWRQLRRDVGALAASLRAMGVQPGDCVAGFLPNTAEAVVALLAAAAVGAVWTVCSPEFGTAGVTARLRQAEPKVLVAADGYRYAGKEFDRRSAVAEILDELPTVRHLIAVDHLTGSWAGTGTGSGGPGRAGVAWHSWSDAVADEAELRFADVPFDHPLWILWSSGTTGPPKGMVQGHGGIVVELLKALGLGADVRPDDRCLFHTSTAWMLWNFMVGCLLHGATLVLYDGSPTHPDVNGVWRVAEVSRATMVGVGASYLTAGESADAHPASAYDLSGVRSVLQTGSSLPDSTWRWVYDRVADDVWLQSICGGTDVCSVLAGGSALLPVRVGRIQCPALGVALAAWDRDGRPVEDRQGELVVTAPLPSMPLYFLGDPDGERYRSSYFDTYPGVWRHGDWISVADDLSVVVAGRSDATLNRLGVRMGSAELYAVVEALPEIADSLVVGVESPDGTYSMPLFVVPASGADVDDRLKARVAGAIKQRLSPRHVPDAIVPVAAVPRTLTGKKLEVPVKRILQGAPVAEVRAEGTISHPEMLAWFADFAAGTGSPEPGSPEPGSPESGSPESG